MTTVRPVRPQDCKCDGAEHGVSQTTALLRGLNRGLFPAAPHGGSAPLAHGRPGKDSAQRDTRHRHRRSVAHVAAAHPPREHVRAAAGRGDVCKARACNWQPRRVRVHEVLQARVPPGRARKLQLFGNHGRAILRAVPGLYDASGYVCAGEHDGRVFVRRNLRVRVSRHAARRAARCVSWRQPRARDADADAG